MMLPAAMINAMKELIFQAKPSRNMAKMGISIKPTSPVLVLALVWPRCDGRIICDSMSENTRQHITIVAIVDMTCPKNPTPSNNGEKAAMVVMTPKTTGVVTRCVPSIAPGN